MFSKLSAYGVIVFFTAVLIPLHSESSELSCNANLINKIAGCISSKSNFLTTRKLGAAGAIASSAGGKLGVEQLRKNFADYLTANRNKIIDLGARQGQIDWADDWKKDAEGARKADAVKEMETVKQKTTEGKKIVGWPGEGKNRYPPRIKEVDGVLYDIANIVDNDIQKLPQKFHGDNQKSAQIALDEAIEQLKNGKALDEKWKTQTGSKVHDAWLANNSWAKDHPVQGKSFKEMMEMAERHPDPKLRAEAKANVALDLRRIDGVAKALTQHARSQGAKGTLHLAVGRLAASNTTKNIAMAAGPAIGVGLLATELGGDTPFDPEECLKASARLANGKKDDIPGSSLRVRDVINSKFDSGCFSRTPEYTADSRVLNFLISSDEEKNAALKNVEICDFYKNLSEKSCPQYKVDLKNSKCDYDSGKATIDLNNSNKKSQITVNFNATGRIKSIMGSELNGYFQNEKDDEWLPYSVPTTKRRGVEVFSDSRSWQKYDGQKNKLSGAQKSIFDRFEGDEGWGIASNFQSIEQFVNSCAGNNRGNPTSQEDAVR